MTRNQRLRRVAILCCHCLRNLAFYRAWHLEGRPHSDNQFWVTANGNALDATVLEWCKLFGDPRGKHYYAKVVSDPVQFRAEMLDKLKMDGAAFEKYLGEMKTYRDKFVAHLDDLHTMHIPAFGIARGSVTFLYNHLLDNEDDGNVFHDVSETNGTSYYNKWLQVGRDSCKI